MHGPCGHFCAKVAPFTWLLPMTTLINNPAFDRPQPPLHTQTTMTTWPPYKPNERTTTIDNGRWSTWPAQRTNGYNGRQATSPVTSLDQRATSPAQRTNNNDGWRATPPALRTKDNNSDQLVNGHATTSRRWWRMSSSLSVNLGEHHDSPPHLLYSHENQGATPPSVTWQLTLGFLLLTTLPTPGLCPTSPLRSSACRAAMGSFV